MQAKTRKKALPRAKGPGPLAELEGILAGSPPFERERIERLFEEENGRLVIRKVDLNTGKTISKQVL